jgi:octaprenyl-diphosphate synthase
MKRAAPLAASIEMIHAASLLHDDVLDNAAMRRGKPSSNVKWGNQISILVGDFLWCRASGITVGYQNGRILGAAIRAVEKTTEGEILEIIKSNDFGISEDEYLKIITLKTAMLFACSCQIGAIFANASERHEEALKDFGLNLGIAFQLADDVLDYNSSEEKFGKKTGTDLGEGKLTLPVISVLKKCSEKESHVIREALLANSMDASIFKEIKAILNRYGTLESSLALARNYSKRSKAQIEPFKQSIEKDALLAMADYAVARDV